MIQPDISTKSVSLSKFSKELLTYDSRAYEVVAENISNYKKLSKKSYICKVGSCRKYFNRTQNLVMHLRAHFKVKVFPCQVCLNSFSQKGNLLKHLKQHTHPRLYDRKRIVCNICGNKFTEKYNLNVSPLIVKGLSQQLLDYNIHQSNV